MNNFLKRSKTKSYHIETCAEGSPCFCMCELYMKRDHWDGSTSMAMSIPRWLKCKYSDSRSWRSLGSKSHRFAGRITKPQSIAPSGIHHRVSRVLLFHDTVFKMLLIPWS